MPILADIASADTAWLQYPAIALLAGVLWWLGRVIREAMKDHKETMLHVTTQHRETIVAMMTRHDAESVRRDARCDKEHEKRDEIACEMKTAIEALTDEIRNMK